MAGFLSDSVRGAAVMNSFPLGRVRCKVSNTALRNVFICSMNVRNYRGFILGKGRVVSSIGGEPTCRCPALSKMIVDESSSILVDGGAVCVASFIAGPKVRGCLCKIGIRILGGLAVSSGGVSVVAANNGLTLNATCPVRVGKPVRSISMAGGGLCSFSGKPGVNVCSMGCCKSASVFVTGGAVGVAKLTKARR